MAAASKSGEPANGSAGRVVFAIGTAQGERAASLSNQFANEGALMLKESNLNGRRRLPPIEKRWQNGVSGNPRGRPRKQECLTSLLKEEIAKICPADREKQTWKELIVRATLQLAMKGNATALK